jgi:sugar phosphate isomerase/epimerase
VRLGGLVRPESLAELEESVGTLDTYGLSAIVAPRRINDLTDDEATAYGERARELGIVVGEAIPTVNLLTRDLDARTRQIDHCRTMLLKSELMQCHGVVILVGSPAPANVHYAAHPYLFTDECRAEFREVVLRIVDGLDLKHARLLIEPWNHSFFYRPRPILEFIESLDDPRVAVHLDQMNMIDQDHIFRTTEYIDETFDLLGPYIGGVHFKDLAWDWKHMFLKFDEVLIGDGVIDYDTYLRRVAALDGDIACFCEHLSEEGDYAINFARLHKLAADNGLSFTRRGEEPAGLPSPAASAAV